MNISISEQVNRLSWKIIDVMFRDNPNLLVAHHIESFDLFLEYGIKKVFTDNNPILFIEDEKHTSGDTPKECRIYMGGKSGNLIYFGKPVIYDEKYSHFMYPNEARLRNMTYGITIHYDIELEYVINDVVIHRDPIKNIYFGNIPIMLQSNACILNGLNRELRFNMGECRNDFGGYFIIDGNEKVIVSQEKFADNMLNIKVNKEDNEFSHVISIRSVSENTSKPVRTTSIHIVKSQNQIVVLIPNVRLPVPLFIVMRALGIVSDKRIIEFCLLDLKKNEKYIDLFNSSIHDANKFYDQVNALQYIAQLIKNGTINSALEILSDYFLPHIGETNFLDKAYFIGHMVFELLKVFTNDELPTKRDHYKFKRVELPGVMLYELFREYYILQKKEIYKKITQEYYYHISEYTRNKTDVEDETFFNIVEKNYQSIFSNTLTSNGIKKAFKGNWGSQPRTSRPGACQELNRLSWNSFMTHMRKLNLPLDSTSKVVEPRSLNSSQYGFIDPVDAPDGGNIGLHKHLSMSTRITTNISTQRLIEWITTNMDIHHMNEYNLRDLSSLCKVFVNGSWIGVTDNPIKFTDTLKLYRRNNIIPIYISIAFYYTKKQIFIYSDAGRLVRPIYYIHERIISYNQLLQNVQRDEKDDSAFYNWDHVVRGFGKYSEFMNVTNGISGLLNTMSVVDFVDASEEETAFIASDYNDTLLNKYYTHLEIEPSLIMGVMGNQAIFPDHNPVTRNAFFCGQAKQAIGVPQSNYRMRFDKKNYVLNYAQIPLIKSKYLKYINNEEQPYGVNTIVAIMSYTGYNVEDAILINKASLDRGLFNTSCFATYETFEESATNNGEYMSKFSNIEKHNVQKVKDGYDYSKLNEFGIVSENTVISDDTILIGKVISNINQPDVLTDDSVKPKKGQGGTVDKCFITNAEDGHNIAKVRICEDRIPEIGDKMASRAGQKGTIGLVIPEHNMPFTKDGVRPDLIVNPHAFPSRQTLGQVLETILGKVCTQVGGFGDCTAFKRKDATTNIIEEYKSIMISNGYHSSGNEVMYDALNGEQLMANIFVGPTYYMRLKHMVSDKINYRARGPNTVLTRQAVQGKANDGGLRIGEMEKDSILGHGMSYFLNESFLVRGDEYYIAVCNKTGSVAIYNESKDIFFSPMSDGPLEFNENLEKPFNVKNISRFGRSFSILKVPYSFKLMIQELQVMNIQMKIITNDNINQLTSMNYSNNVNKLLHSKTYEESSQKYFNLLNNEQFKPLNVNSIIVNDVVTKKQRLKNDYKVNILVPFRDNLILKGYRGQNRTEHLVAFKEYMSKFIPKVVQMLSEQEIDAKVHITIIEQTQDDEKFNRGALLNVGYLYDTTYDAYIFHDVDLIPNENMLTVYATQYISNHVVHFAAGWERYSGDNYIGGVTLITRDIMEKINGFPNNYWGWGGEDDEMNHRLKQFNISVEKVPMTNPYQDLENIRDVGEKRMLLKKDELLDNTMKQELRQMDETQWNLNGLKFLIQRPNSYKVVMENVDDLITHIYVDLNCGLLNYLDIQVQPIEGEILSVEDWDIYELEGLTEEIGFINKKTREHVWESDERWPKINKLILEGDSSSEVKSTDSVKDSIDNIIAIDNNSELQKEEQSQKDESVSSSSQIKEDESVTSSPQYQKDENLESVSSSPQYQKDENLDSSPQYQKDESVPLQVEQKPQIDQFEERIRRLAEANPQPQKDEGPEFQKTSSSPIPIATKQPKWERKFSVTKKNYYYYDANGIVPNSVWETSEQGKQIKFNYFNQNQPSNILDVEINAPPVPKLSTIAETQTDRPKQLKKVIFDNNY